MLLNLLFIVASMAFIDAAFTLPGLAGLVLSALMQIFFMSDVMRPKRKLPPNTMKLALFFFQVQAHSFCAFGHLRMSSWVWVIAKKDWSCNCVLVHVVFLSQRQFVLVPDVYRFPPAWF